jgi:hypothetical protein
MAAHAGAGRGSVGMGAATPPWLEQEPFGVNGRVVSMRGSLTTFLEAAEAALPLIGVAEEGVRRVCLDLSRLEVVARVPLLWLVLRVERSLARVGGRLVVVPGSARMEEVLFGSGARPLVPWASSRTTAVAALATAPES